MPHTIDKSNCKEKCTNTVNGIGDKIRKYRKEKGISQEDLAFYCFTDKSTINKIEKGAAANITIYTLIKIATVLGQHISVFF